MRDLPQRPTAFLLGHVRRRPVQFGALFAAIASAGACSVGVQYGMKLIVDTMALGDRASPEIWRWLALFVGLIAAESAMWRVGGWLGCRAVVATGVDVRLGLFRHLAGHSMRYFSEHLSGALGNRITATAGAAGAILGTLAWKILPPVVDFAGAIVVLLTIDPRMALALIAFVLAVGTLITAVGRRGAPLHQAYAERGAWVGGELVDTVANIWTVKAFAAREREHRRLMEAFGLEAAAQRRSWLYLEKVRVLHDLCLLAMAGGMLVWALLSWRDGTVTPGDVVVISALTFRILHGSRDLALALVDCTQQFGVIGEMLSVIARPHQVADRPGALPLAPGPGAIELSGVTFSYGAGRPVLRGLDLKIPAGQRIGIVGPSGAGKSTLIGLIQRLDDVQAGWVAVDGQRVTAVTQDSLRASISIVPQDIALFHRSLRDNIRYGRPDAADAEILAAARDAHCGDFVGQLPHGFDTVVGERGSHLSGGQRQRVGIARALLKNAPVLLLDEATSALDSHSEGEIQRALHRLMRGRTVVAVAHRLATVSAFDRVVVMVDGRIVEDGPPARLREAGGMFARLWQLQAEGFETA